MITVRRAQDVLRLLTPEAHGFVHCRLNEAVLRRGIATRHVAKFKFPDADTEMTLAEAAQESAENVLLVAMGHKLPCPNASRVRYSGEAR